MAGSYLLDIDVHACYGCGADVEPGYHFCARCLNAANITPCPRPAGSPRCRCTSSNAIRQMAHA